MAGNGDSLNADQLRAAQKVFGAATFQVIVQQPTFRGFPQLNPQQTATQPTRPNPPTPAAVVPPRERRTPIVPEESGLRAEDWLAPLERSMKDAQAQLDLVAEEFVRVAAAGKLTYDTFDQTRKAMEYLNGRGKEKEQLDKKLGKDAVTLRDAFNGVQKSLLFAVAANAAFDAELKKFASAASPGLLRAWEGSLQLLAAELGSELIPVVMSTTDTILDLVDWFAGLDDTTKKLIAGGALAVPAVALLGHSMTALGPAARVAGLGVRALIASLGPLGATVAAIGVIAGGAAASMAAANYFYERGHASPEAEEKAGQQVTASEITATNLRVAGRLIGAEPTREEMGAMAAEQQRQLAAQMRELAAGHRNSFLGRNFPSMSGEAGLAANLEQTATLLERMATAGFKNEEEENRSAKEAGLLRQARHYSMMLTESRREQQPRYSALAEARKTLQLQILGKSPFEQQLLNLQRKNAKKVEERLNRVLHELEEMNGRQQRPG